MGALQLALVARPRRSTLEGVPVLALAIDGAVGQVASVVHGFCDWYNTGSYLVRRLDEHGIAVDRTEVRRLTNAALMSRGKAVDERALGRSTELRLIRSWVGRGLVDALPFGSTLGRASSRAAARIDESDLPGLVSAVRAEPGVARRRSHDAVANRDARAALPPPGRSGGERPETAVRPGRHDGGGAMRPADGA